MSDIGMTCRRATDLKRMKTGNDSHKIAAECKCQLKTEEKDLKVTNHRLYHIFKTVIGNSKQLLRVQNESTSLFKGAKVQKHTKKLIHTVVWWVNGI